MSLNSSNYIIFNYLYVFTFWCKFQRHYFLNIRGEACGKYIQF